MNDPRSLGFAAFLKAFQSISSKFSLLVLNGGVGRKENCLLAAIKNSEDSSQITQPSLAQSQQCHIQSRSFVPPGNYSNVFEIFIVLVSRKMISGSNCQ